MRLWIAVLGLLSLTAAVRAEVKSVSVLAGGVL
jgi:hypothetical protein